MISYRRGIVPELTIVAAGCDSAQLQLTRNNCLGEISFANEVGDDRDFGNFVRIEQKQSVPQARFFLPESAMDIPEHLATANFSRMHPSGLAGVGVDGGTVTDDEQPSPGHDALNLE